MTNTSPPEFNHEQETLLRFLRVAGVENAEEVIRGNLTGAAYFGAYLAPFIDRRAAESLAQDQAMAAEMLAERDRKLAEEGEDS